MMKAFESIHCELKMLCLRCPQVRVFEGASYHQKVHNENTRVKNKKLYSLTVKRALSWKSSCQKKPEKNFTATLVSLSQNCWLHVYEYKNEMYRIYAITDITSLEFVDKWWNHILCGHSIMSLKILKGQHCARIRVLSVEPCKRWIQSNFKNDESIQG